MSYQVLARKWRPQRFEDLVGQEHVQRALVNALKDDRLHHAYLFTGTRGVGKTTIARIFSKALNCETGITATPCGTCATCVEIAEGRYVDLIEVDAASRTGVDDTRELLENVQYAPTRGRYKVYLIDEVHMFSKSSFNALLKTLEEPPPHVKFLLATTDPEKLPVTILSRCLQFNLKRLPVSLIISHLQHVLTEENVEFNVIALQLIAEAADGSMRDALSLLDQALAFGGGAIQEQEVRDMLGSVSRDRVIELLRSILSRDAAAAMQTVAALAEFSPDYENVLAEMLSLLHHMSIARIVPESLDEFVSARDSLIELSEQVSAEDLQLFYQIALIGRRDLSLSPDPRSGFEMVILRMLAFRPAENVSLGNPSLGNPSLGNPSQGNSSIGQRSGGGQSAAGQAGVTAGRNISPEPQVSTAATAPSAAAMTDAPVTDPAMAGKMTGKMAGQVSERASGQTTSRNHVAAAKAAIAGVKPDPKPVPERAESPIANSAPAASGAAAEGVSSAASQAASRAASETAPQAAPRAVSATASMAAAPVKTARPAMSAAAEAVAAPLVEAVAEPKPEPAPAPVVAGVDADWSQVVQSLPLGGQVMQLAVNCVLKARNGADIQLQIESGYNNLLSDKAKLRLQQALGEYYDIDARLEIEVVQQISQASPAQLRQQQIDARQRQAVQSIEQDSFTRSLIENFDAEIVPGSIRPAS
jgi:DNA polymerase-3 subunit gamma/tau